MLKMTDEGKDIPLDTLVLTSAKKSEQLSQEAEEAAEKNLPRVARYLRTEAKRLADQSQGFYEGTLPPDKRKKPTQKTSNADSDANPAKIIAFPEPQE